MFVSKYNPIHTNYAKFNKNIWLCKNMCIFFHWDSTYVGRTVVYNADVAKMQLQTVFTEWMHKKVCSNE